MTPEIREEIHWKHVYLMFVSLYSQIKSRTGYFYSLYAAHKFITRDCSFSFMTLNAYFGVLKNEVLLTEIWDLCFIKRVINVLPNTLDSCT